MYTDAMILYQKKYGVWPELDIPGDEAERIHFVELFTALYLTKHQHEHAGQNAPGSEGIKQVLYTKHAVHDELTVQEALYKKNETSTKAILFFEHTPLPRTGTQICHSPDVIARKGL